MRKVLLLSLGVLAVTGAGVAAWWATRPEPQPEGGADERKYEDIPRPEYEAWARSIGYVD